MYNTSLYLRFIANNGNQNLIQMFFEDWVDRICNNEVKYTVIAVDLGFIDRMDTIRVDFVNTEDATVMKLKGIPGEFRKYLSFIDDPGPHLVDSAGPNQVK